MEKKGPYSLVHYHINVEPDWLEAGEILIFMLDHIPQQDTNHFPILVNAVTYLTINKRH